MDVGLVCFVQPPLLKVSVYSLSRLPVLVVCNLRSAHFQLKQFPFWAVWQNLEGGECTVSRSKRLDLVPRERSALRGTNTKVYCSQLKAFSQARQKQKLICRLSEASLLCSRDIFANCLQNISGPRCLLLLGAECQRPIWFTHATSIGR